MRWMSLAPLPPLLLLLLLLLLPPTVYPTPSGQHPPATDKCGGPDESNLNSFLWTVRRDPPSYFFGTIHVPYTRVWDYIPANAKQAFRQAENVFFELDLTDPYTISALASCQLLPHGENLANVLPGDIYRRLERHLEYVRLMMPAWMTPDQRGRGLYAEYLFNAIAGNWERKRPVWVMLMVNSLTESDIKARGIPVLDLHLAQEAERAGKGTGAVERVEEQCVPLNELNFSQVVFALNQTLWQHEFYRQSKSALPYTTDDLIDHYNCGDLNSIMFNHDTAQVPNLVNSSLPPQDLQTAKLIDQYFRNELIDKRNQRMAERVMKLLNDHPTRSFFFAFGAGHFLGNNTVIHRLREAGFEVEHTQPGEEIPVYEPTEAPRSKRPGKNILSSVSTHSLLPSDVIYGDIQYLYKKKLRHEKRRRKQRRKHLRQRKRQKQLNSLWESLDPDTSRPWDADRASGRDQKGSKKRKPFNDLWVRMDNEGPNFLHHQFSRSQHPAWQTTLRPHMEFSRYRGSSQASSASSPSLQLLLALSAALLLPRN